MHCRLKASPKSLAFLTPSGCLLLRGPRLHWVLPCSQTSALKEICWSQHCINQRSQCSLVDASLVAGIWECLHVLGAGDGSFPGAAWPGHPLPQKMCMSSAWHEICQLPQAVVRARALESDRLRVQILDLPLTSCVTSSPGTTGIVILIRILR